MTIPPTAGRHLNSTTLLVSDLGLPGAAGAQTTVDNFLTIADDASLERAYIDFLQATGTTGQNNAGTMTVQLFQTLADGGSRTITVNKSLAALPTEPVDLGFARGFLKVGRPLFLRLVATPPATTPWWDTGVITHIHLTLHMLSVP